MENTIAGLAFGLGFFQLYDQIRNVKDIDFNLKSTIIISIISSILWFIFQFKRYGLNMTTLYTSTGLIVQLYVLNAILVKEKNNIKE